MDLRRLEYLGLIADYGSFSKAATVIGIAQPALGRHIRKLEEDCGAPLLYRNGRGASLTAEGAKLLASVRPLLRDIEVAISEVRPDQRAPKGSVSIGMTPALSRIIGYELVTTIKRRHPQVALNVVTGYSGYLLEWLTSGRIDAGILDNARRADHLIFDPLAELKLSLVSATSAVPSIASAGTVSVAALHKLPLVLPTRNHGLRRTVELAAADAGAVLNIAFELDSHELVREIVIAGAAHTIMAAPAVRSEIARGELAANLLDPLVSTRLLFGTSTNRPVTTATRVVCKVVQDLLHASAADTRLGSSFVLPLPA